MQFKSDKSPNNNTRKIIYCVIAAVALVAIIIGVAVFAKYAKNKNEQDKNKDLYYSSNASSGDSTSSEDDWEKLIDPETGVLKEFSELYKTNSDVVGWLKIAGTKMDVPVVKGTDNVYYLDHTLQKEQNAFGVPFADYRATFAKGYQSTNVTIYGHAAKDGTLFAPVKEYNDLDFYKEHPTVTFDTIYGKGEYKIIGRFIEYVDTSNTEMFNYHDYVNLDEEYFNDFVEKTRARSYFDAPVDVEFGDQLLTLSTCNIEIVNSLKTPYRDVLVARKVRPDESAEVDVEKATINKDMVMPDGWKKHFKKDNPYS